jgi:hypothetical protein
MTNTLTQSLGVKLVLNTQYMENYGAHSWDGEGECPQHWKAKGGTTYVIESSTLMSDPVSLEAIRALIQHKNDYSEVFIRAEVELPIEAKVCEEYETFTKIYRTVGGEYRVTEITDNEKTMCMRSEISVKTYDHGLDYLRDRKFDRVVYELTNGEFARDEEELKTKLIEMGVKF